MKGRRSGGRRGRNEYYLFFFMELELNTCVWNVKALVFCEVRESSAISVQNHLILYSHTFVVTKFIIHSKSQDRLLSSEDCTAPFFLQQSS